MERCDVMVKGEYISEIYRWYTEEKLVVNRRYQRKLVWTLSEKQQFINTIIKNYPVPLFLLVNSKENKEVIDGLQRLEAIISFILNKFSIEINGIEQYFNLDVYPGNGILLKNKTLEQKLPVMDSELCRQFMLYQLPISTINANEAVVDDIFKRINSTGRKLSPQDLRQAGVVSRFSDLVRIISMGLRGDITDGDIVKMNEIADYSLSSSGLNYGLDIEKVFWVEQGIITDEALRRSKDEEIIAILCSCILSNNTSGMSVGALRRLYMCESKVYTTNEELLVKSRFDDIVALFQLVVGNLEKIFSIKNMTFKQLVFKNDKNYNKDYVFIVIFLAFAQLYTENYQIEDFDVIGNALNNIADNELSEIIRSSECEWNAEIRNRLVIRIKNILLNYMVFKENNPNWNAHFLNLLKQVVVEGQMFDFKIGLHDLRSGHENENLIPKCVKTLIAMANTRPCKEGVIIIGISDKQSDAIDFEKHYGVSVSKYNEYYVSGIKDEATRYYGSIQKYMDFVRHSIETEEKNVHPSVIHYILTTMDTMKYENQTLIVLKLSTDKPLFYKNELYVRYDSNNELIKIGSDKYYDVFNSFQKRHVNHPHTNN